MKQPGYAATPLLKKLGIKPGMKILLIKAPADYFDLLETDLRKQLCENNTIPDFIHLFVKSIKEFTQEMQKIKKIASINTAVIIWVSWYKNVRDYY